MMRAVGRACLAGGLLVIAVLALAIIDEHSRWS